MYGLVGPGVGPGDVREIAVAGFPNKDGSRLLEPRATARLGSARPILDELLLSRAKLS